MYHFVCEHDREKLMYLFSDYKNDGKSYLSRRKAKKIFGKDALKYAENCGEPGCEWVAKKDCSGGIGETIFTMYGIGLLFEYYRIEQIRKGKCRRVMKNWEQWFYEGCLNELIDKKKIFSRE